MAVVLLAARPVVDLALIVRSRISALHRSPKQHVKNVGMKHTGEIQFLDIVNHIILIKKFHVIFVAKYPKI